MKNIAVKNFIESLAVSVPPFEKFLKLADMTAIWTDENQFKRFNYERGQLLYALIAKYKPKTVLEFGTDRGYGTLCMAWAMSDLQIPGKIYTIDTIPPDEKVDRIINRTTTFNPVVESLSLNELWSEIAPPEWLKKIQTVTGYSGQVMDTYNFPKIEMAYIDAGHFYEAVRHDFFSVIKNVSNNFGILFDDYIEYDIFGVKKLIDAEIDPFFDGYLIKTDTENLLKKRTKSEYGMYWLHSTTLKKPLNLVYPDKKIQKIIKEYLNFEKRLKIRNKLNHKFPILLKIRFRFWNR